MTIGGSLARSLVAGLQDDATATAAAALAEAVSGRTGCHIDAASLPGVHAGALVRAAADFERRGWLVRHRGGWTVSGTMPGFVPAFLQGVVATRADAADRETCHAAVTMPHAPSALAAELPATGTAYASLLSTAEGMTRVAAAARERLTIMTPFLNSDGLKFAASLFSCSAARNRTLVVRNGPSALRALLVHNDVLVGLGVRVKNYRLPSEGGYETFHAKVVLADEHVAYIGSANMLGYAHRSVELGVLVEGRAARVVASVVNAVEAVAPTLVMA